MPTKREREYYAAGYRDGIRAASQGMQVGYQESRELLELDPLPRDRAVMYQTRKTKRKLSAWNKYVKNPRNHIKWKTGSKKGMLNLGVMATAFRRKKKRR
jgi:hypothetical protein